MAGRVLVLGYFGYQSDQLDGQTIKTRNVFEMLKLAPYCDDPTFFDTESFKQSKLNLFKMFLAVWKTDKLVYVPAHNNLKYFFPFIYLISVLRGISINYVVVGGWLADFIKNKPLHKFLLPRIDLILPQTADLTKRLQEEYGFNNVMTFPNFRIHNFEPLEGKLNHGHLKLVFMARVRKMKGIDVIFEAIDHLRLVHGEQLQLSVDFYGPIFKDDQEYFEQMVNKYHEVSYKGKLDPSEIYGVLSKYDALLLPTKYYTEGFPGSVLDAYISGIPVVVTDWQYSREFVGNEVSGLISKWDSKEDFIKKVGTIYNDRELLYSMKNGAIEYGRKFSMESAMTMLEPYFDDRRER